MKARPLHNYKILGTDIVLDHSKTYDFSHATNQPDWEKKGLIFIHENDDDSVGVLLETGEYVIV